MTNHYKTLNVSENASQAEIKKAYRKLAIKFHPDKTNFQDTSQFIKIKNAYDVLIDPASKRMHDQDLFHYRNLRTFDEVDLRSLNERYYSEQSFFYKILGFVLRIAFSLAFVYICGFVYESVFSNKNQSDDISNTEVNSLKEDSLNKEDQKIEKKLENTEVKQPANGDIKF